MLSKEPPVDYLCLVIIHPLASLHSGPHCLIVVFCPAHILYTGAITLQL